MSPTKRSPSRTGIGSMITLAIVVIFGVIYMALGSDPLGILGGGQTPTPTVGIPTAISVPPTEVPTLTEAPTEAPTEAATKVPPITTVAAPAWWQVYFVNPIRVRQAEEEAYGANGLPAELLHGSITEKLIQHIDAAQVTIHIASFETDLVDVAKALIRAKERGVDVRWITDDEYGIAKDRDPGHGQFKLLKEAGIEIKDDARGGLMHDKFWLFDGKTTWTGSTNVTVSGMFEQNNNVIVIESPELTAIYERQWADMWSGKFNAKSPSTVDQQKLTLEGTNIQVLFSPEDKAAQKLVPYIQSAKKSIYFLAFTYTQPQLGAAMLERAKNGVRVSGVFEKTGSDTEYSQMPPLFCAKAPVRQDGNFAFMHHKVIVIDERFVVTGSLNFTDNASETNNENVIILDNPEIARLYIEEFQRVWVVATDPDPAKTKCK
jgi:phosphatidylserine/phosphatidylglycerophosphate/cardiolipin synthase-like enzyme